MRKCKYDNGDGTFCQNVPEGKRLLCEEHRAATCDKCGHTAVWVACPKCNISLCKKCKKHHADAVHGGIFPKLSLVVSGMKNKSEEPTDTAFNHPTKIININLDKLDPCPNKSCEPYEKHLIVVAIKRVYVSGKKERASVFEHQIICTKCETRGPTMASAAHAIKAWNALIRNGTGEYFKLRKMALQHIKKRMGYYSTKKTITHAEDVAFAKLTESLVMLVDTWEL